MRKKQFTAAAAVATVIAGINAAQTVATAANIAAAVTFLILAGAFLVLAEKADQKQ